MNGAVAWWVWDVMHVENNNFEHNWKPGWQHEDRTLPMFVVVWICCATNVCLFSPMCFCLLCCCCAINMCCCCQRLCVFLFVCNVVPPMFMCCYKCTFSVVPQFVCYYKCLFVLFNLNWLCNQCFVLLPMCFLLTWICWATHACLLLPMFVCCCATHLSCCYQCLFVLFTLNSLCHPCLVVLVYYKLNDVCMCFFTLNSLCHPCLIVCLLKQWSRCATMLVLFGFNVYFLMSISIHDVFKWHIFKCSMCHPCLICCLLKTNWIRCAPCLFFVCLNVNFLVIIKIPEVFQK